MTNSNIYQDDHWIGDPIYNPVIPSYPYVAPPMPSPNIFIQPGTSIEMAQTVSLDLNQYNALIDSSARLDILLELNRENSNKNLSAIVTLLQLWAKQNSETV